MLRLDPTRSRTWRFRGLSRKNLGEYGKAIADYREAIRLDPQFGLVLNNLAWILATCPDEKYRDGKEAVAVATKACELTEWKKADDLNALSAAYAEAGDFDNAVKWQSQAVELTADASKEDYRSRLELYKAGKPYRDIAQ